ncbi:Glycosyl hydrolase 92 [Neofusicoccum parvum]|uniref:Glycosyl hydrolase 92 n=1 Tax=Neofusicoccum parvum TaxID=310453 RepID=A0ACB5RRR4_9PEZI|nr:Glycosyl hydrolase 92 [Neofusicoccum parvum]
MILSLLKLQLLLSLFSRAVVCQTDWASYVDAFIGTSGTVPGTSYNGGNVFPGAAVPFGAVKCGIDFNSSINANAGYTPDGNVTAISLLHESGTGGAVKYGVVAQMPLASLEGVNVLDNVTYSQQRIRNDSASPGYYRTDLANGVTAEMSATEHVGIIKYSYGTEGSKYILVDVSHYLPSNGETQFAQFYSNGRVDLLEDGSYSGYGVWRGGWNGDPDYQVYFCGRFSEPPTSSRLFSGPYTDPFWPNATGAQPTWLNSSTSVTGGRLWHSYADRVGALFEFPANASTITSKVGVSWISADRACAFADDEVASWELNDTVAAARRTWNDDVLSRITTMDLANKTRLTMFYSALYKAHLIPSDRTGENPHWTSDEPYYDDYYAIWDTFRCLNSLWLLIEPERAAGMVQGGSNADNVLADAYVKGLGYGINWTDAYAAMKTDAEMVPYNTFDSEDITGSTKEGRGALLDWLEYGFVTPNYGRAISKTVEYALNDFSLSQVAKDVAPGDYQKYLQRSAGWQKTWISNITSFNFTGFLAPVFGNGTVLAGYDPANCGECEWTAIAYEATPWEYCWTIPFDMQTLIALIGGPAVAERRLDTMFIPGLRTTSVGSGGTNTNGDSLFNPGNEPSFGTPFLYNYLGRRQHKSVMRARQTVDQYYGIGPSGLPGNSDGGALDSWMVWNMVGLYPVVTQPVYLILSPWFADVAVVMPSPEGPDGETKWLNVTAEGLGEESFYVQSLKVNGVTWDKSWLSHDDIKDGVTLDFVLGTEPAEWDTGELPPSPGHVVL